MRGYEGPVRIGVLLSKPSQLHTFKVLLACGVAMVCVAAGESLVRVFAPVSTPSELLASSLEYFPSYMAGEAFPAMVQNKIYKGVPYAINRRGTRGPEFALPKPPGTVRVVVLGGSAVFDIYSGEGEDWASLTRKELETRGVRNVEVINAGTPGHSSWNLLGRLASDIWLWEPDYIVFYLGWNDIKYYRWLSPEKTLLHGVKGAGSIRREGRLLVDNAFLYLRNSLDAALEASQLYVFLRTRVLVAFHGALGVEGEIPYSIVPDKRRSMASFQAGYGEYGPRQFALNLEAMLGLARAMGAKPILFREARMLTRENLGQVQPRKIRNYYNGLDLPTLLAAYEEQEAIQRRLAKKYNLPLLIPSEIDGRDENFVDQVHTTPAGSHALARQLAGYFSGSQIIRLGASAH